jgi:RNA polymerase sigma-70 factor (ECF subfamily)
MLVVNPEAELIYRAQHGDRHAFARLVDRYWQRLYRWLYRLTHDHHLAEDLAQDSFLKAFAHLDTFRAEQSFPSWLFRIAHNNFVNKKRSGRKVMRGFPEQLPAPDPEVGEEVMTREMLVLLARVVGRLPVEFRAAFLLRTEEDLSFREIAAALHITEETARWRVFKARQKIMEVLRPQLALE